MVPIQVLQKLQKHQDAFASAFGFFLIGFDAISRYGSTIGLKFFALTDPVLWFFKVSWSLPFMELEWKNALLCAAVHICQQCSYDCWWMSSY